MPGYGVPPAIGGKGLIPWRWAEQRLTRSHNYWFATTRSDGTPHVMPVWGIWVDSVFYFSTGRESRKSKNLAMNPHCAVCTDDSSEAVIVQGEAKEIRDADQLKRLGRPYYKKYKPWKLDPALGPVYAVVPRVVFAFREKDAMQSATRWKFGDGL